MENEFIKILDKNEELKKYYKGHKEKRKKQVISNLTKDKLIEVINDARKHNNLMENEDILNGIDKEKHRKWIENDSEYFKEVLDFLSWFGGFSGNIPFEDFYNKTIDIYKELYKEEKYEIKIDFVLKKLNIGENEK